MTAGAETRCGFVAVLGAPNAGKSTLVNTLVGGKVTIVSPKIQTTRSLVKGIVIRGLSQVVLVDTPGLFTPHKKLERAMVAAAWQGRDEADIVLLIVDASRRDDDAETAAILDRLATHRGKRLFVLALNKIDNVRRDSLLSLSAALNGKFSFDATFMISALKADGTDDLLEWIAARLPEGPWLYDEDQISDLPSRLLAAEITREKLFKRMHDELPYALTVETEAWEIFDNGSVKIDQTIYVARESQRPIILGKGGAMIKSIGESARQELENIFGHPVHLKLFVKVQEGWSDDPQRYAPWGLDHKA